MGKRRYTTAETRKKLYAAAAYIDKETKKELGLLIPVSVYVQDPYVDKTDPKFGFDKIFVRWEPGLQNGPTSSRFAIVDYNSDTNQLAAMAKWDSKNEVFLDPEGSPLNQRGQNNFQFHQVNVWATLQRALDFFEQGQGLGRPLPFGFEGNRLIVVPHAGYGKNAYYDRTSKSLQFYYFDDDQDKRIYTCLSADIINHEFGHAVLDGVRPFYIESHLSETRAFHEFVGDISAILLLLRHNKFRKNLADTTQGNMSRAEKLSNIAEEFGRSVLDKPYLRSANNDETMSGNTNSGPHKLSEVLTGAMYDILLKFSEHYLETSGQTAKSAYWNAIQRMQRVVVQPLDLLPPVDVSFRDYALAVLRAEELANPSDPDGYINTMLDVFIKRGILNENDRIAFEEPRYVYDRLKLDVFHDINSISRSRAGAYRFLNDNRLKLLIPDNVDVFVADLYDSQKYARQGRRLPRQIILEYLWRENINLDGEEFGEFNGRSTTMLCGGTLVFDENGSVLWWTRKPGSKGGRTKAWLAEIEAGKRRKGEFLNSISSQIAAGLIGSILGGSSGMLGSHVPIMEVEESNGSLRFNRTPHLCIKGEDHDHYQGAKPWEISS